MKKDESDFNASTDITCEFEKGALALTVNASAKIKNVELFVAEGVTDSAKRCWQKVVGGKKQEDGSYKFTYLPYQKSAQATFFALVTCLNGFVAGTKIINKKFSETDVLPSHKSKILYSSRIDGAESVFSALNQEQDNNAKINLIDKELVTVKKGPMEIEGVGCKWGLNTFKFATEKDRPNDDSILMFDVYSKTSGEIRVSLVADYFGKKTVYTERVKLLGGDVWQNVKIAINRYKTPEGMGLKTYEKIEAIQFDGQDEFLINNALWV